MADEMTKNLQLNCFQTLMNNSTDMHFFKDLDLVYITCSTSFAKMVGLNSGADIVGKTDFDIFDTDLARKYTTDDNFLIASGTPIVQNIERLPTENGKNRYSSTSKFIVYNENDVPIGTYGIATDVTSKMELEEEKETQLYTNQFYLTVIEFDLTENKLLNFESYTHFSNLSSNINEQSTFTSVVEYVSTAMVADGLKEEFCELLTLNNLISNYEKGLNNFCFRTKVKGVEKTLWVEVRLQVFYSRYSNTIRAKAFVRDINALVQSEILLKTRAESDALTGLLNRDGVVGQIRNCLKGYGVKGKHALLFIDLDNFKYVNDNFGHKKGDLLLQRVAETLKSICREDCILGRIGGDEFIVLIKNIKNRDHTSGMMTEICQRISHIAENNDVSMEKITCSVGCSMYNGDGKRFTKMYEEADKAMYKAKELGKNTYRYFDDDQ